MTNSPLALLDRPTGPRANGSTSRLSSRLAALDARLADPALPLVLTLVLVLLATDKSWYVAVPVTVLAVVGLAVPTVIASVSFWMGLAATLGAAAWAERWQVDNHQFLIVYWCLAVGLAAHSPDPDRVRRLSARLLVGAVFVLAATWKLLSPDFVDGSFLRYTLLTDERFSDVAALVGGVDPAALEANRSMVGALGEPGAALDPLQLTGSLRIDLLATVLTWWTLLIEAAVAVTFLAPWRWIARHRDWALIVFIVTTYAVAPVVGFGWVLVCLGLAQHDTTRPRLRMAYLGAFLLVQVYVAPWTSVMGLTP